MRFLGDLQMRPSWRRVAVSPMAPSPDSISQTEGGRGTGVPSICTSAKRQLPELLLYAAGVPAITDEADA